MIEAPHPAHLQPSQLKAKLREFLELRNKTKLLSTEDSTLKMHILLSKNTNKTVKDKLINYKLLRVNERIFQDELSYENAVIINFLLDELLLYYRNSRK